MARIILSPSSKADILTAAKYIAEKSQSLAVAESWIDSIDEKLTLLSEHPRSGPARPDLAADVRSFPVGSYVIFYRAIEGGIQVARVLHGARDIPEAFRTA